MKAIILAGGEGTRLRPLTLTTPKPLIPIHGKTLTEHLFDILRSAGVTEVTLSLSYMAGPIKDYFAQHPPRGLKLDFVIEETLMGTAGPFILLKRNGVKFTEDFFVCNGDNLFNLDTTAWLSSHQKNKAIASLALTEVEDVSSRGVVELDGQRIIHFVEKPKPEATTSHLINSGYYIFSPKLLDYIDQTKNFLMLERDVFPQLATAGWLFGFYDPGQWFDTGTPERYEQVQKEWIDIGGGL